MAAAAIMVCVFGSFVIGDPLRILGVFGLGLAVAVLVDATVVRVVLGPAVMQPLDPPTGGCPAGSGGQSPTSPSSRTGITVRAVAWPAPGRSALGSPDEPGDPCGRTRRSRGS